MEKKTYIECNDIYINIFMYNNAGNIDMSLEIYLNVNIKNNILSWIRITYLNYFANNIDI